MGKFKGWNGSFSGKVGNVVGYTRNGQEFIRILPQRTAPPTEAELRNRFVFKLVQAWVAPIKDFLKLGFRDYSQKFSGIHAAISVLHKEALHRDGYQSRIEEALVRVSHGSLGLPQEMEVVLNEEMELIFNWQPGGNGNRSPRDRVMLLAYNVEEKAVKFQLSGAMRHQGSDCLSLVKAKPGLYHVYAAFVAADGSRQSNSQYLGTVTRQ